MTDRHFYKTAEGHRLPHDPFKAIVTPRPIGWISTRGLSGSVNLAPYSFFNAVSGHPPMVMFASSGAKDSVTFAKESGVFACNFVSAGMADKMNATSASLPRGQSEFGFANLAMAECTEIDCPHVTDAAAVLECRVTSATELADIDGRLTDNHMIIGQVVAVHIDKAVMTDGYFDVTKAQPLARMGYLDYAVVDSIFQLKRPG